MTDSRTPSARRIAAGRRLLLTALASAPLIGAAPAARAQAWPAGKPIRLAIPSGAGGGADPFTRTLAEFMSKELGTSVVVDNKPGANGILASESIVRQPADGYSLLITYTAAIVVNKLMQVKMSHDPVADLTPIGRISGGGGNLLIVHPDLPIRSLKDLVAYAKAQNGKLNYASWGIGSGGHLTMESVKAQTGMRIEHVPYKSSPHIVPDLVSGVIPVAWIDSSSPVIHIRNGRMRAIATSAHVRLPQTPDVQTLTEQGLSFPAQSWYGMFGPKGMPPELTARINEVLNRWLLSADAIDFFEQKQNSPAPKPSTPAAFGTLIQEDLVAWAKLLDQAGIKPS